MEYNNTALTNIHFPLFDGHSHPDSATAQMQCGRDGGGEKEKQTYGTDSKFIKKIIMITRVSPENTEKKKINK